MCIHSVQYSIYNCYICASVLADNVNTADLNKEIRVKFITIFSGLSFYPSKQQKIEYAKVPKLKPMGTSWSLVSVQLSKDLLLKNVV